MPKTQPHHDDHARLEEGLKARGAAESVREAKQLLATGLSVEQVLELVERYGPQAVEVAKQLWAWWQAQRQPPQPA